MSRTVVFDFDGTLADTIALAVRVYNQFAPSFKSKTVEVSEVRELIKLGYARAAKAKKISWFKVPKLIMSVSSEMKAHMHEVKPYPGVVECLQQLKKSGIQFGVLTSNQEDTVRSFFTANNFPEFDFVVSEKSLFGKDKALKRIIKNQRLNEPEVIYIGDEPRDIAAAHKIGIRSVGVTWGVAGPEGFGDDRPDFLVDNSEELKKVILDNLGA